MFKSYAEAFDYACTELNGCLFMGVNSNVCTTCSSTGAGSSPSNLAKLLSFHRPLGPLVQKEIEFIYLNKFRIEKNWILGCL